MKLINFRLSLFCAIGIVVGILCAYNIMFGEWLLTILFFAIGIIALTLLIVFKSKLWKYLLFVLIFALIGITVFQLHEFSRQDREIISQEVTLTGRVSDIDRNGNVRNVLYLENCTYDNQKIKGRVYVPVFDGDKYSTGDIVTFHGTLRSTYLYADNMDTDFLRNNVSYQLTDATLTSQNEGSLKFAEKVRKYIFDVCQENMFEYSGIMYALLTGDDNAMDPLVKSYYQNAGLIHLLAVSGMHIVYIITILGFFLNRFKLHPMVEFAIIFLPLVAFSYVCRWVPSMTRAMLMTVCVYLARWVFGRYDLLTSLSWSVVILLCIQPNYLFDVGWQLSVLSVFGMATLHARIDRFLQSKKLKKFWYDLLSSISVSLSCTVATFPVMAHFFESVPVLGVFANIIAVPTMSWSFTLGIIGMIPWVFSYFLHPADGILIGVTAIAKFVSSLDFAVVHVVAIALAILVAIVWLLIVGQYLNLSKKLTVVSNILCAVAFVVCFVVAGIKIPCKDQIKAFYTYDSIDIVATQKEGNVVVVSNCEDDYSFDDIQRYLSKLDYDSCTWYVYDFSKFDGDYADSLVQLKVSKVYLLSSDANDVAKQSLQNHGVDVVSVKPNTAHGKGILVQSVYDGSLSGVIVEIGEITVALSVNENTEDRFCQIFSSADIYALQSLSQSYIDKKLVTFSLYQEYCDTNYGANKYGNFTIGKKDGTIVISFK